MEAELRRGSELTGKVLQRSSRTSVTIKQNKAKRADSRLERRIVSRPPKDGILDMRLAHSNEKSGDRASISHL